MKKTTVSLLIKLLISISFLLSVNSLAAQTLAFPGAEGYGRYVTGGRGGVVYEVTNLNDTGTGSFRDAVSKTGARTIVFKVSGTIVLNSRITITNGDLTIAGQTAPGDGICVRGYDVNVNADNVIIRFMRFRLGNDNVANCECDAFGGTNQTNLMIDHCSMSWSIDEVGSFYDNTNMTMQWCILTESLYAGGHVKGNHGYGGIQGGMGATFHHNLYANNTSRNPRFCGARYHQSTAASDLTDFRNNVITNWGFNSIYGGEYGHQNVVNNYFKSGPATRSGVKNRICEISRGNETDPGQWYVAGNFVESYPAISADNWAGGVQGADAATAGVKQTSPFTFYMNYTQSPQDAYAKVLDYAGACLPKRDALDTRVINQVISGTCAFGDTYGANTGIIDSPASVGGWPTLNSTTALTDTDKDGMPDNWETAKGLNPTNANDRNTVGADGYTNLESYLNELVKDVMGYKLNINDNNQGIITLSPASDLYIKGTLVNITVSPKPGYKFVNWTGDISSTNSSISVTMNADVNLTANFEAVAVSSYTISTNVVGNGSITLNPTGGNYLDGSTVSITANNTSGGYFENWSGDATGTNKTSYITVNGNKSITANFRTTAVSNKKIAYVTDPASTTYVNDTKILTALKADPNFVVTEVNATSTDINYSAYDLILISEVPASTAAGLPALKGINKPIIMMKVHAYKSTTWDWATTATDYNQNTTETNIVVSNTTHPIFHNVNFVNTNEVNMLSSVVSSKGLTYMTANAFKAITGTANSLASIKNNATQSSIIQIPAGTVINGTSLPQNFVQIGINSASYANVTDDAVRIVQNACYYLLGETFDTGTDIRKTSLNFNYYPTLVENTLNINLIEQGETTLIITDLFGKTLIKETLYNSTNRIDMQNIVSGIYFCTLISNGKIVTVKLIKK
jgi:uncharacterized repeat protein (TIGR02543 family)